MTLADRLHTVLKGYRPAVRGDWHDLSLTLTHPAMGALHIRSLQHDDHAILRQFAHALSRGSKELFCPYPWDDPEKLNAALHDAIKKTRRRIDAAYIMMHRDAPVGHCFLWKAGGNPHSQMHQLEIPELGVAIADAHHGKGLGTLSVQLLQEIARTCGSDAIELTTAQDNRAGWHTYLNAGFEHAGMITIPLEVDTTDALLKPPNEVKYREERHMVYIIHEEKRTAILHYLNLKKGKFA